jgi:hypothetical protein
MYQMTMQHARSIGYDYAYFIDQDMILREDYQEFVLSDKIDISKVNVYQLKDSVGYQVTFFHGNVNILCDLFKDENIANLVEMAKNEFILGVENCFDIVSRNNPNLVVHIKHPHEIFSKVNLFSSSNIADIYFDRINNGYIFLHAKGDTSPDSVFSAELLLEDKIIYSNTISYCFVWNMLNLQPNTNYVIKYYDAHISPETLYKTTEIYTDMANPITTHYIEKNPPA